MLATKMEMLMTMGVPRRLANRISSDQPRQSGRIEIKASDDGESGEILLYEFIGYDWWTDTGMTAQRFSEELAALAGVKTLSVRINSPGGDVWDGMSIYNQLSQFDADVHVTIEGIAASAASVIAMAGDKIEAFEISQIMIHDSWTYGFGNEQELRELADLLGKIDGQIASTYAGKSGRPAKEFRDLMDSDTYLTGTEAMELGLVDGVISTTDKGKEKDEPKDQAKRRNKLRIDLMQARLAIV